MWSPTHVHVVVQKADNLLIKGKNDTNNAFVVIELGKESYRTSIKEKSGKSVIWSEECELKIPKFGNKAVIILTAYHRNSLGLDQFLGMVKISLVSFERLQKSIAWYKLEGKPGKEKGKDKIRGELEVEIDFTSKLQSHSLTSLPSKGRTSIERLTGSLFGLRHSGRKTGGGKFAHTLGRMGLRKKKDLPSVEDLEDNNLNNNSPTSKNFNNLDPGVISDEEDSSHKSSESLATLSDNPTSTGIATTPPIKPRKNFLKNPQISISQWGSKTKLSSSLYMSQDSMSSSGSRKHLPKLEDLQNRLASRRLSTSCVDFSLLATPKPEKKFSSTLNLENNHIESHKKLSKFARKLKKLHASLDKREIKRTVDGCEDGGNIEPEFTFPKSEFKNKNKEELIGMVVDLQKRVNSICVRVKDLEDYLDEILVKVMDTVPKILEKS